MVSPKGRRQKGLQFERDIVNILKEAGIKAKRIPLNSPTENIINHDLDIHIGGKTLSGEAKRGGHAPSISKHIGTNEFLFSKRDRKDTFVSMRLGMFIELLHALKLKLDLDAEFAEAEDLDITPFI